MVDRKQGPGFDEQRGTPGHPDSRQVFSLSELPTAALRAVFDNAPEEPDAVRPDGSLAELIQISTLRDARAEREAAQHRRIGRRFI